MISIIKSYLQLCRTHTTPLETIPAIVGASLATGGVFNIGVGLWAIYGILYHNVGYGMNSYLDWKNGYDKNDPHKQHFPLNTGELEPRHARLFLDILFISLLIYGIILLIGNWLAFFVILSGAVAGIIYNTIGKEIQSKSIFIAYAHSTVFAVPYLALNGSMNEIFFAGWAYVFLWVIYQIQIEGDVKDMDTDEENFLLNMGAVYEEKNTNVYPKVHFPLKIKALAHGQKLITAVLVFLLARLLDATIYVQVIAPTIVIASSIIFGSLLLADGTYDRTERIKDMARIELMMILALLIAVTPVIGPFWAIGLFAASLVWVITFNKIQWNTFLGPDV